MLNRNVYRLGLDVGYRPIPYQAFQDVIQDCAVTQQWFKYVNLLKIDEALTNLLLGLLWEENC